MQTNGYAAIESVASYIPEYTINSSDLIDEINPAHFGIGNDLIESRVGVTSMRHSRSDQRPSDLAIEASQRAINQCNVDTELIDLIIFCGVERDYTEPSTAHRVQAKLGLGGTCFDISNACLGFASGMQVGNAMIASGMARRVLVCTGEKLSKLSSLVIDELKTSGDREILEKKLGFLTVGDAGGAVILGPKQGEEGIVHITSTSRGQYAEYCHYNIVDGRLDGQMIMEKICASGLKAHADIYDSSLQSLGWHADSIDCLVTHQVGRRPFHRFSELFSVPLDRMTKTYNYLGNIATATFPVNLAIACESGMINKGDKLFAAMAGSGVTVAQIGINF